MEQITGVILAGGKAQRFGGIPKLSVRVDGLSIFERMDEVLSSVFKDKLIVINEPEGVTIPSSFNIARDIIKDKGPMGGIYSALQNTKNSTAVFVFAGDMPYLDEMLINKMIYHYFKSDTEALIPKVYDKYEPLHGIYCISLVKKIEAYLKSDINPSVIAFLKMINAEFFDLEGTMEIKRAFTNINSPNDLF